MTAGLTGETDGNIVFWKSPCRIWYVAI